jgi:hypothetical protein
MGLLLKGSSCSWAVDVFFFFGLFEFELHMHFGA